MKKFVSKIGRKFLNTVFKFRWGKKIWSAKILFFLITQFDGFEEYSNTGKVNDLDHYVPKFLLKRFRVSENGPKKGKIIEYNFLTNKIKDDADINTSCAEKGWDSFKEKSGAYSDYASKRLFAETLENFGSKVIKRINLGTEKIDLTFLEESIIATYIAFQITRVPAFYSAIERFILYLKKQKNIEISDLGNPRFLQLQIIKNVSNITIDELLQSKNLGYIEGARNHIKRLSNLIADEISEKIYRGKLYILDIPMTSSDKFVISDNPVIFLDFQRNEILRYPAWWRIENNNNLWIFMPISPNRCIFYTKVKIKNEIIRKGDPALVQLINFGQYLNAKKSVFSNDRKIIENHLKIYTSELNQLKI